MRQLLLPLLALLAGIYLCGCNSEKNNQPASAPAVGTVAVVDLDAVARKLGRDVEMVDSIKLAAGQLTNQLNVVQAQWTKEITDKKDEFGEELNDEQTQTLLKMQQTGNIKLNQLRQTARGQLSRHQQALVQHFQDEVRPVAEKIAKEKGHSIVVSKNQTVVFSYDEHVDITDEVAERLSKLPRPKVTPVPARTADQSAGRSATK